MSEIIKEPVILYEDNHIVVLVKPANMLVQGDSTGDPDVLSWLKQYIKEKYNKPGEAFIGLVHRMDRPVGGLLVFARTSKAASRLSEQVRTHELCREYVCVCQGDAPDRFTLHDWLQKDEAANKVKVIPSYLPEAAGQGGHPARPRHRAPQRAFAGVHSSGDGPRAPDPRADAACRASAVGRQPVWQRQARPADRPVGHAADAQSPHHRRKHALYRAPARSRPLDGLHPRAGRPGKGLAADHL